MKKVCYSAFIGFWASLATLLAIQALATSDSTPASPQVAFFSMEDISAHASPKSCWLLIEGKVYDLTNYIHQHPTSPTVLIEWCGKDASVGMRTKGYGRDHSPAAWGMLEAYAIGVLKE